MSEVVSKVIPGILSTASQPTVYANEAVMNPIEAGVTFGTSDEPSPAKAVANRSCPAANRKAVAQSRAGEGGHAHYVPVSWVGGDCALKVMEHAAFSWHTPWGPNIETTVTPMSTSRVANAPRAEGTSRSVSSPVAASSVEKTIVNLLARKQRIDAVELHPNTSMRAASAAKHGIGPARDPDAASLPP